LQDAFLQRLGEKVPAVKTRRAAEGKNFELLALDKNSEIYVDQAMVQIRNEASGRYLKLLSQNPLLVFLEQVSADRDDKADPDSPTLAQMQSALSRMEAAYDERIAQLETDAQEVAPSRRADRALLDHKRIVERILSEHQHLCPMATKAYKRAQMAKATTQVGIAVAQIGASLFTLATCSTVIYCVGASAVLSVVDYSVARNRTDKAFKLGLVHAAAPSAGSGESHFKEADEERRGATLAPGFSKRSLVSEVSTAVKSTIRVIKATRTGETVTCQPGYRPVKTPGGKMLTCVREK
jgi:hypothetical protein